MKRIAFVRHMVVVMMVLRKLLASAMRRNVSLVDDSSFYRGFRRTLSIHLRTDRQGYLKS